MYSTIKPKRGFCPDCTDKKETFLTAGRCRFHNEKAKALKKAAKLQDLEMSEGNDSFQKEMELASWFRSRVNEMTGNCTECGERINRQIFKYAKCGVAHIFPKSTFKSIATHPDNWLELGATCGCHSRAEDYEKAMKMKIFPEMLRRMKILLPEIHQDEIRRIPEYILKQIN